MKKFFGAVVLLYLAGMLAYLAANSYLATFSRYMADDFCETINTRSSSTVASVIQHYQEGKARAASRYSNLLFVGTVEAVLGEKSIGAAPAFMLVLWGVGLIFLTRQIRIMAGLEWHFSMDVLFGALLAFLSVLIAPNRFQSFFWRSAVSVHFAPLVFLNFLVAVLLFEIRSTRKGARLVLSGLALFFSSFIVGGFSEPPVAIMIVGVGLAFAYIWFFEKDRVRRTTLLFLTGSVFAGATLALVAMVFSPALADLDRELPSFIVLIQRTGQYTYHFLADTVRVLPLPILVNIVCPALISFMMYRGDQNAGILSDARKNLKVAVALPILLVILIAAGFSTSAYGQSYPAERARFFAHVLMTITLVMEGILAGLWFARAKWTLMNSVYIEYAAMLTLLIMAFYPIRSTLLVLRSVPEYSARAQVWDRRDAHIYELRVRGQTDLTVPQFDGIYDVKELDSLPTHWVNRCAAAYYGVNSIRAIPIHGADALEEYYNYFGGYDQ